MRGGAFASPSALVVLTAGVALGLSQLHCGKGTPPKASAAAGEAAASSALSVQASEALAGDAAVVIDEVEQAAWNEAADGGDPAELVRIARRMSCEDLRARASIAGLRLLAVRAMAYCPDFTELPWLAETATTGPDDVAAEALDAILEQAARPRRAVDPEDAEELRAGCTALLALARAPERPRIRRIRAVAALRMLSERGCVARADIPTDVDAK
jgi:hypothetical protein